jgi:3'-5' exoribonuclease
MVGDKIFCKGKVRRRKKKNCLDLVYISKSSDNLEEKSTDKPFNVEPYIQRFEEIVESIVDPDYRQIIDNCFNDDVKELFFSYPAARGNHHNYLHGLLQHTVEVVDISLFLADYFGNSNKDLLSCAGLLHDIGKLKSYDIDDNLKVTKTDWEFLLGHLSISSLFVSKITPADIDPKKIMVLYHTILSHHRKLEWGSPVVCKMKEAYILSMADELSSTLNHLSLLKFTGDWSGPDPINSNITWFRGV